MRHVLLIGEDNPHSNDPRYALYDKPDGCAGDRLRRLVLGVTRGVYLRRMRRLNLCEGRWSAVGARSHAAEILAGCRTSGEDVALVLLGRKVAGAFGLAEVPAFSSVMLDAMPLVGPDVDCRAVLLPHPSGRCREWNAPDAFERAQQVLREAAPEWPWGWAPEGGP